MTLRSFRSSFERHTAVVWACLILAACGSKPKPASHQEQGLSSLSNQISTLGAMRQQTDDPAAQRAIATRLDRLERAFADKRAGSTLATANMQELARAFDGHTTLYPLTGNYKVLVIPVQFEDVKFVRPEFYSPNASGKVPAQDYLFGDHKDSMSSYYRHASKGVFKVGGEIAPIITVPGKLVDYGEAVVGANDKNPRGLVVEALLRLREQRADPEWWAQFDNWDLNDYDADKNFHEPDGFIDAVVLIYAGKDQASCQRAFDPTGQRPASAEVPPGPRHDATVECFNRIWPHRWSLSLPLGDPHRSEVGPVVEGIQRPSFNSLKITENLFAFDYNMQSEFSDRSTFMHEFGHSLSLPDVYASNGDNSTGSWELMSSNARLQAQEFSSYSKVSLGWLMPKVIRQGETTSAYLGNYDFVSSTQRDDYFHYIGPETLEQPIRGEIHTYDIVSTTPDFGEGVYRSLAVVTEPQIERPEVVAMPAAGGHFAAYSDRFDGDSRTVTLRLKVPATGDAILKLDTYYHVETETNWDSNDATVKVVTDYDLGAIKVNGTSKEVLRIVSGDDNFDTLAEKNPACEATRVLELRAKRIAGTLTPEEAGEFDAKTKICQAPVWVTKQYDLSELRGQDVEVAVEYVTDGGYNEVGIVVDNVRLGDQLIDFENKPAVQGGFTLIEDGKVTKRYQQLYLMEYRTPGESYLDANGREASFNMDNNVQRGVQGMFVDGTGTEAERFRLVTWDYQPGVLVWYFNSRWNRIENNPRSQNGQGYLLVLNSKVKEVPLPGALSKAELFDATGAYNEASDVYKQTYADQRLAYVCFSHIEYYTYMNGVAPDCGRFSESSRNLMKRLTLEGKRLVYRREGFNDFLPVDQYGLLGVGEPFTSAAGDRTGLSTFRAREDGEFAPFKVYKVEGNHLVLDEQLTASSAKFAPVSTFRDALNAFPSVNRFKEDTVAVVKKGFAFEVVAPSRRVVQSYRAESPADENDSWHRRPRAKVLLRWEQ